jgi:hypothetical protein
VRHGTKLGPEENLVSQSGFTASRFSNLTCGGDSVSTYAFSLVSVVAMIGMGTWGVTGDSVVAVAWVSSWGPAPPGWPLGWSP